VAGRFVAPDGTALDVAPTCRIRATARPTPGSRIAFELWLPRSGWNGRYYQLGNGGFGGSIHYPSLAAEIARGNAALLSDTGHSGTGFDARWAAGGPDLVVDFGHRAIKASSDAARALIAAYYGRPADRHYFAGCSGGGRMALMAAQRYPDDWDGILAGAPANLWTRRLFGFAALQHRLRATPGAWLPPAKLPAIQRAALAACPAGTVRDGYAADPRSCRFDPRRLLCRGGDNPECLTAAEVETVRLIQAEGFEATSAAAAEGWADWILNADSDSGHIRFATEAMRFFFRTATDWEVARFDPARDRAPAWLRTAVDADSLDYSRFRARGGRIISYFGWADPALPPHAAVDYYRRVEARMGGVAATRQFYRLFMVPGMGHCQSGPGPDSFGQSMVSPPLLADPEHDVRLALEAWVERGRPPNRLVAVNRRGAQGEASGITGSEILRPLR